METTAAVLTLIYHHAQAAQPHWLKAAGPAWTVSQVKDSRQLVIQTLTHSPTVAFLSSDQWSDTLLDTARRLHQLVPRTHVVVQMPVDRLNLAALWQAQASGYLDPGADHEKVTHCLLVVMEDRCYLCPAVLALLNGQDEAADTARLACLSTCERKVFALMAQGLKSTHIADQLCRSEGTIKKHKDNLIKKLGLPGMVELYRYAERIKHHLASINTRKE